MSTHAGSPHGTGLEGLFDASPAEEVHTSGAALTAFLCSVAALLAAPFTLTASVAVLLAVAGSCCAFAGLVATSRRGVAGRALVPAALFLSVVALTLVGLRYAGLDTAVGDQWLPTLMHLLDQANTDLHLP